MKQFEYTINDPLGIHARPAGMLVKEAKAFADTVVTITKNGTTAKAGQLMKLMSLGVKQGDVVTVAAEGANEDAAIAALTAFLTTICKQSNPFATGSAEIITLLKQNTPSSALPNFFSTYRKDTEL